MSKVMDIVLDTDTYNEVDDQFALAYILKSKDRFNLKAIYAVPFKNQRSNAPEEGMLKSYDEIIKILDLMDETEMKKSVYKGSREYLTDEETFEESPAARHLVELSKSYSKENPLYVVAIGCITNVSSAILMDPTIIDRIEVVWLGGHAYHIDQTMEFNMFQDVAATRVLFDSKVKLTQVPCMGVVSHFTTTAPELSYHLKGKNKICDYLVDYVTSVGQEEAVTKTVWSRIIWDVCAVAYLASPYFTNSRTVSCPRVSYDGYYSFDYTRHNINYVHYIDRDKIMQDLFDKLSS